MTPFTNEFVMLDVRPVIFTGVGILNALDRALFDINPSKSKMGLQKCCSPICLLFYCDYEYTFYSHSIVAGGLDVMSYTMRLICATSLTMRTDTRSSTSYGMRAQSAVIKSVVVTERSASV